MPFLLVSVSYVEQPPSNRTETSRIKDVLDTDTRNTSTPAIATMIASRWQTGIPGQTLELTGLASKTQSELQEEVLPLLQLADGCVFVGPADLGALEQVADLCESVGYHLPISEAVLELDTLAGTMALEVQALDLFSNHADQEFPDHTAASQRMANIIEVLRTLFEESIALPQMTLQHLSSLGHQVSHALGQWFEEAADWKLQHGLPLLPDSCDIIDQLAFTKPTARDTKKVSQVVSSQDEGFETDNAPDGPPDKCVEATLDGVESANRTEGLSSSSEDGQTPNNVSGLLGEASPFADILPGFQVRPGQLQMLEAVSQALQNGHHLLAEAGTGTGKSLAYLIPAALHAKSSEDRVIVSTHTIALQDQVSRRDFPLLQKSLGTPVSLAVFKGRTHYVCMRKMHQELRSVSLVTPPEEVLTYMRLLVWLTNTGEGNREELTGYGSLGTVWPRIQSETETCISKRCPFFKACYYFRARAKAYDANVVVTNHSLVFTDLKANHHVLPHYNHLIFDEAHHLEQEATNHLGSEVGRFQSLSLIGRLSRDNGRHGVLSDLLQRLTGSDAVSVRAIPTLERLAEEVGGLRALVEQAFASLALLVPQGQSDFRITPQTIETSAFKATREVSQLLEERVSELESKVATLSEYAETEPDEDLAGRLFDAIGFMAELSGSVRLLASAGSAADDWVEWVEVSGNPERRQVVYHQAPIDVSGILRERLFETKESVVMTSATLSVAGDFSFLKQRLGLDGEPSSSDARAFEVQSVSVASPFDYGRQALLCVPTDVPDLSKMTAEDASVWLSDSIYQLARISGGRLLTLFTSHAMLRATAEYLRRPLAKQGLQLLAQGIDGNRTQLLRMFQDEPRSVLLGAQSFWEGIDLPGDQLTTLCIVRLPFTPPTHPVTAARNERIEAEGKSAFWHNSLPEAVVRFRQGVGRLIRTVDDKGVVVVFDKRVVTSRYGEQFIRSVPNLRTFVGKELDVLRTVKSFLA